MRALICDDEPAIRLLFRTATSEKASRSSGATACFDKLSLLPRLPALLERYGAAAWGTGCGAPRCLG